jgi:integrase
MGSPYRRSERRPDGTVVDWPTWWLKYYQNGRPVRESSGTSKETVARRMLKDREGDVAKGVPITPKVGRVTFDEAADDLETDYNTNKKRSLETVRRHLTKHLKPYFKNRRLAEIRTDTVRAYIAARQTEKAANATINRELSALKRMFSLSVQAAKLHAKPHVPMLQENNVRTGFFEHAQFTAVRNHLPEALQPVATFAYYTGWRTVSEVLPLRWHQVDMNAGIVRLDPGTTKNREGRTFPLGMVDDLRLTLEAQKAATEALQRARGEIIPWVFHRDGESIRNFRKAWMAACKAAGCPARIPHDFRRTAVRNLVRAGVPEKTAMQLTGHKTRSVFDRYDIVDETDLRAAAAKLNALMGTVSGTVKQNHAIQQTRTAS